MHLSASLNTSVGVRASLVGRKIPESDAERAIREVAELRNQFEVYKQDSEIRVSSLEQRVADAREHLIMRAANIESRLSSMQLSSLRRERFGALLFIVGTGFTLTSAIVV